MNKFLSFCGRILGGSIIQYLGIYMSVNFFAPQRTIFWWTQSAICMTLMLHTPDKLWYERSIHVLTGLCSYLFIRRNAFPLNLLLSVCICNALGQIFGYCSMKYYFKILNNDNITTTRFLYIFTIFPSIIASLISAVPGSFSFYSILEDIDLFRVFINYFFGHLAGTISILYPCLIVPILFKNRKSLELKKFIGLPIIISISLFNSYFLFGFTVIVIIYGIIISTSMYMDQFYTSIFGFLSSCVIMGSTIARKGPFNSISSVNDISHIFIATQMGITTLTLLYAFISIIFSKIRNLELFERMAKEEMKDKIDKQMINLFRIGHDLNNNSTLVKSICDNITEDDNNVIQKTSGNLKIIDAINTLNGVLVSDMIDVVKQEPSKVLSKEGIDIVDFIDTYVIVGTGMVKLSGKDIKVISLSSGQKIPLVFTNKERLHQIMCNLVTNAIKYTKYGKIELSVTFSKTILNIHIEDTGIGISKNDMEKIFDPFFRCNNDSNMISGSGVGLSNVKKICNILGASIDVSSPGLGCGSKFTLSIERGFAKELRVSFNFRVLVVDDSFVIRKLLKKYLISMGCDVVSVDSVENARVELSNINKEPFDVIMTDGSMEGQSGTSFISDIRNGEVDGVLKNIPCILCSGEKYNPIDSCTLYICKPFSKGDIAVSLDTIVHMTGSITV